MMEGSVINEAAKVFYRKIALRYLMAHSPLQKKVEWAKSNGMMECFKCGELGFSRNMWEVSNGCYCKSVFVKNQMQCAKCYKTTQQTIECGACENGHQICAEHAKPIECEIVAGCDSKYSNNCRDLRSCATCARRMCFRHWRIHSNCMDCHQDFSKFDEEEKKQTDAKKARLAQELRDKRATKKTKQ
jgi:hypothetical protein